MTKKVGIPDICERYNVTKQTIYRWRREGMPYKKEGRKVVFNLEEVETWLENRENEKRLLTDEEIKENIKITLKNLSTVNHKLSMIQLLLHGEHFSKYRKELNSSLMHFSTFHITLTYIYDSLFKKIATVRELQLLEEVCRSLEKLNADCISTKLNNQIKNEIGY